MSTDHQDHHQDHLDRTLSRLYGELGDRAREVRLPPAAAIRRRADARSRSRTVLAVAAAVVLAAGVLGGARLLGGEEEARIVPAPQPTITTPPPTRVTAIPAEAFLGAEDIGSDTAENGDGGPADLCGRPAQGQGFVLKAQRSGSLVTEPGQVPLATVVQDVAVYASAAEAAAAVDHLRDAVRACPEDVGPAQGGVVEYDLVETPAAGDEVVLVRLEEPSYDDVTGELDPTTELTHWIAAVRVGDTVTLVSTHDHEASSVDQPIAEDLVRRAADRLSGWRR